MDPLVAALSDASVIGLGVIGICTYQVVQAHKAAGTDGAPKSAIDPASIAALADKFKSWVAGLDKMGLVADAKLFGDDLKHHISGMTKVWNQSGHAEYGRMKRERIYKQGVR